ncbi:MAG: hypothetical protein ACREBS_11925 [Nitrososphaerales archaeon]
MAEYKRQTILGIVIASIVGLTVVVGVLYLSPKTPISTTTISTGACAKPFPSRSQFPNLNYTFPNGTIPIQVYALTMPENSSGQLCVFYAGDLNETTAFPVRPTVEYFPTNDTIRPTSPITISSYPANFSLIDGGNQSIAYTFNAPQGSKGIYFISIPGECVTPPLVVGYKLSQLNASDFVSWTYARSCSVGFAGLSYIGLTNIQVGWIPYYYGPS